MLRYGENPHQPAALYVSGGPGGLATANQLHGKAMSYNNYVDADAAHRAAYDFDEPAVAVVKHANPCGIAIGGDIVQAHAQGTRERPGVGLRRRDRGEPPGDVAMAEQVAEVFTEVIVAPDFEPGALEVLTRRKNIRILRVGDRRQGGGDPRDLRGSADAGGRRPFDAAGDDPARGRWPPGNRLTHRPWPTWRSPGGPVGR